MSGSEKNQFVEAINLVANETIELDEELMLGAILADPELSQYSVRKKNAESETIVHYRRIRFVEGQQTAVVHFPIEPALANVPNVEGILLGESIQIADSCNDRQPLEDAIHSARINIATPQKFGVRAEVSLSRPTPSTCSVLLEVVIESLP